jgi:hypothetical protein
MLVHGHVARSQFFTIHSKKLDCFLREQNFSFVLKWSSFLENCGNHLTERSSEVHPQSMECSTSEAAVRIMTNGPDSEIRVSPRTFLLGLGKPRF